MLPSSRKDVARLATALAKWPAATTGYSPSAATRHNLSRRPAHAPAPHARRGRRRPAQRRVALLINNSVGSTRIVREREGFRGGVRGGARSCASLWLVARGGIALCRMGLFDAQARARRIRMGLL
ncbi:hypothetical protein GUJ93_ZPchr0007g6110 [Zizania palustris]|uniref:Uncharacterized protein n=1 Tax=Zizania palustris TaxID=103762 RepID=A0A8J5TE02_ZIZPA|nr:hypothetical protein GUJ93_ZPchr0007g6110 [Zizania palustris]